MKSTIPPGTGIRLSETTLRGTKLTYISNPEFLREGQAVEDWCNPDRIVIGGKAEEAIDVVTALYESIDAPLLITDTTSAEMIKYASNAFLATRISFINEIAALCDRVGATIDDVSRGMAVDPRIGSGFLQAGVGYGGSCFPKDVRALDQFALTNNHNFELLRSVITVNNRQRFLPLYTLRERFGHLNGVTIGVLGLAFKPHTDDMREAPALDLIRALVEDGAQVKTYDPTVFSAGKRVLPSAVHATRALDECAEGAQALVLMTEWPEFVEADWERLAGVTSPPRIFFDGRNALDPARIMNCGFEYIGVGRGAGRSAKSGRRSDMPSRNLT
jgi:UDPglucose 6-dehydrogenase